MTSAASGHDRRRALDDPPRHRGRCRPPGRAGRRTRPGRAGERRPDGCGERPAGRDGRRRRARGSSVPGPCSSGSVTWSCTSGRPGPARAPSWRATCCTSSPSPLSARRSGWRRQPGSTPGVLGQVVRHSDAVTGGVGADHVARHRRADGAEGDGWWSVFEHVRTLGEKDLALATELGDRLGVPTPMADYALERAGACPGLPGPGPRPRRRRGATVTQRPEHNETPEELRSAAWRA